jgi:opacity protein-like surface antigen
MLRLIIAAGALLAVHAAQAEPYVRVDGGYSWSTDASIRDKDFNTDGFICADTGCTEGGELNGGVGNSGIYSIGLGWRFNPNVRIDLSGAYRGGYSLADRDQFPSYFNADVKSTSVMLAGYYDLPYRWVQPYVGAGVGWARNKIGAITNSGGALAPISTERPGGTWSGMAWSVMLGVGIPLWSRLTLDIGYRYTDLGKIESRPGDVTCSPTPCPGVTYSGLTGRLRAHEVTGGLRF